jgi:hypothetical protein
MADGTNCSIARLKKRALVGLMQKQKISGEEKRNIGPGQFLVLDQNHKCALTAPTPL